MTEEWRPVVGYEGLYEISTQGNVRSLDHVQIGADGVSRNWVGGVMSVKPGRNGYPRVNLTRDGKQRLHNVHIMMLEAFVGPRPEPHWHGRHLNDVKTDNLIGNLAWGSPSDNNHDRVRNGKHPNANKTHCKRGHEFNSLNTRYHKRGRTCRICESNRERTAA